MYQRTSAPQSIGGVLDSGFKLFRACIKETFLLAAVATLVYAPFGVFAQRFAVDPPGAGLGAAVGVGFLVLLAVSLTLAGAIIARIDAIAHERELPLAAALNYGARRGPALFGAGLCYALAVAVGFVLLVIPGFIVMVWLIFGPQISITERLGPITSLKYSRELVRGHWWRTAALVTVIGIIVGVLYVILGLVVGIIAAFSADQIAQTGQLPWYVDFVLNPLLAGVTTPLAYSLLIATFYDLKNRHEGGDIAERIAAAAA